MRILDKYMLREFVAPFLFGVAAFTAIFIGADLLFRIAQLLTSYGASVWSVTKVFFLALPKIIVYTFPMSVLLGALMAVARTSGSSELIVMRTAGQSFTRLIAPIIALSLVISMATVLFNEYVVPAATYAYEYTIDHEIKNNVKPQVHEHIVLKDVNDDSIGHLLYARKYDDKREVLQTITIQEFQNNQLVRIENAPEARWQDGHWIVSNGTVYDISGGDGVDRMLHFEEQVLPFTTTPTQVTEVKKKPETMTIRELTQQIQAFEAAYVDTTRLQMELHQRFSLPLASFVFALIGAPLGVQRQRSSSSLGFGLSVIVIFIYYALMTFTAALGEGHVLAPAVAVWLPNILAAVAGVILIRRASR